MTITITPATETGSWQANSAIEGAPDIPTTGYTHIGKLLRPGRVIAKWGKTASGWTLYNVAVRGPLVKKDGTPGQVTASVSWSPKSLGLGRDRPLAEAPEYVQAWVAEVEASLPKFEARTP